MPNTHVNDSEGNRLNLKQQRPTEIKQTNKILRTSSHLSVFTVQLFFFLRLFCCLKQTSSVCSCTAFTYFKSECITQAKTKLVKLSQCITWKAFYLQFRKIISKDLLVSTRSLDFRLAPVLGCSPHTIKTG